MKHHAISFALAFLVLQSDDSPRWAKIRADMSLAEVTKIMGRMPDHQGSATEFGFIKAAIDYPTVAVWRKEDAAVFFTPAKGAGCILHGPGLNYVVLKKK